MGVMNIKKKMSASITVEAVFIVPLVLGVIFSMILMLFFIHDKAIITSYMNEELVTVALEKNQIKNKTEWVGCLKQNLWIINIDNASIKRNKIFTKISFEGKMKIDLPVANRFLNKTVFFKRKVFKNTLHPETIHEMALKKK